MDWADVGSRRVAFRLLLEDVEELKSHQTVNPLKRKAVSFDFALEVYRDDLRDALRSLGDGVPAPAITPASRPIKRSRLDVPISDEGSDGNSLELIPDTGASGAEASAPLPPVAANTEEENREKPDGAAALAQGSNTLQCISCGDERSKESAAQAPCGHFWRATVDEGLFPPQCCTQPIPLTDVSTWLPSELVTEFEKKQVEFTTPNRLYCANKRCSAFIIPANIAVDRGSCTACGRATCTICKAAGHRGICSRDSAKRRTMALAKRERWQKCYGCKTVVELGSGCNRITCRCGKHFCYLCGKRWKACACTMWSENRIIHDAA
ncbi:hypothetical protein LLEC1_03457 [Akanthomyces lecanii]|uniref:RBR-type E3 ubiquitin transferase n=1 Tax=Cordyceps confragosa TaxID=2714763 RepID=A0A179IUL9_CORDF|nr:hypothetical protein LLEC1_03457 [Akanthomyces lecanii]